MNQFIVQKRVISFSLYKVILLILSLSHSLDEVIDIYEKLEISPDIKTLIENYLQNFDTSNRFPHSHPEVRKHIDFVRWIKEMGGQVRKTKIVIYDPDYRGIHATVDLKAEEVAMRIPIELAISCEFLEHTDIGKMLILKQTFDERWTSYMFPLIYILEESKKEKSWIRNWLEVIPKEASDHPMFFNEEEKKWIEGSTTLNQIDVDRKQIEKFYNKICSTEEEFRSRHTLLEFTHFYYILCSRFFGIYDYDPNKAFLVPYADLINTEGTIRQNAYWDYDDKDKMFLITTSEPVKVGEPLRLCYGHHSNFTYFTFYGMVVEEEEYNSVCFLMHFDEQIPHFKLKASLVGETTTMTKKCKFYQCFSRRIRSNKKFVEKCRFYWSGSDPMTLTKHVVPPVDSLESIPSGKRKIRFPPISIGYEKVVLTNILNFATEQLSKYKTSLEEEESALQDPNLSYKKHCSLKQIVGEKKSLAVLREFCLTCLDLLNCITKEGVKEKFLKIQPPSQFAQYVETELMHLFIYVLNNADNPTLVLYKIYQVYFKL